MDFKKEDENYIYGVIGKNVKKYRKKKNLTQEQLANQIDYSLSFVSGLESKKHQTFSLGALWRISLILGIDMYKLCIDDNNQPPKFVTYKCDSCNYTTDIPYSLLNDLIRDDKYPIFDCCKCNSVIRKYDSKK